jgi:fatty-acyl-CoA synthase
VRNGIRFADTGDLGRLDADGNLTFTTRADDMINVAGLNVYPQDVERCVMAMDGVTDAVAFRLDDAHAGDRVGLIYSGVGVAEDTVRTHCRSQLAGFQHPTIVEHVSAVPRQANGKISRRDVAAQFTREREAANA